MNARTQNDLLHTCVNMYRAADVLQTVANEMKAEGKPNKHVLRIVDDMVAMYECQLLPLVVERKIFTEEQVTAWHKSLNRQRNGYNRRYAEAEEFATEVALMITKETENA